VRTERHESDFLTNYLLDWCDLLLRWLHVVAGIAWIGASFYFVWLDDHLEPPSGLNPADPGVAGELWAVHGGGFYRSRKYAVAPATLPPRLHWFYWEAYTTWLSGFGLLALLYFHQAAVYLIDPAVMALSQSAAVAIALGVIIASWIVYDGLCRSPLASKPRSLATMVALIGVLQAWGLCHIFSGRGAFMVFGASWGTIMVANVLLVIIPGQRELVRAKRAGREPDPGPGLKGKQRSIHNTYFTLPVLFVMISPHYAMTYGARDNWLVLIGMSFAGACIRGWFVARHKPQGRRGLKAALPAALGALTLVGLAVALAPKVRSVTAGAAAAPALAGSGIEAIVQARCVPCHSKTPSPKFGFAAPPNGVRLDTLSELRARRANVEEMLSSRAMPPGNVTGLTDEERAEVLTWIAQGAHP
jgi:uncharacterized membrane protein